MIYYTCIILFTYLPSMFHHSSNINTVLNSGGFVVVRIIPVRIVEFSRPSNKFRVAPPQTSHTNPYHWSPKYKYSTDSCACAWSPELYTLVYSTWYEYVHTYSGGRWGTYSCTSKTTIRLESFWEMGPEISALSR